MPFRLSSFLSGSRSASRRSESRSKGPFYRLYRRSNRRFFEQLESRRVLDASPLLSVSGELRPVDPDDEFEDNPFDEFTIELKTGDVVSTQLSGNPAVVGVFSPDGTLVSRGVQGVPIPGIGFSGGVDTLSPDAPYASLPDLQDVFVALSSGSYTVRVDESFTINPSQPSLGSFGSYELNVRVFDLPLPQQNIEGIQTLYLDFDGASVDSANLFGSSSENTGLFSDATSALFQSDLGFSLSEIDSIIDVISIVVGENYNNIASNGANGDFGLTSIPGQFGLQILDSRTTSESELPDSNVSRVIFGDPLDANAMGVNSPIAEFVDVGNFDTEDIAIVPFAPIASLLEDLNQIPVDSSSSRAELFGTALGNIASHEAGHLFGLGLPPFYEPVLVRGSGLRGPLPCRSGASC